MKVSGYATIYAHAVADLFTSGHYLSDFFFFFCFNMVSNCVLIAATAIKFQLLDCIYGVTSTVEFGACMS